MIHTKITKYKGYTLIELIIVLGILATLGLFILSTLFLTLRSAKKAQTLAVVRQNGNYTLTQVANIIRNAKQFNGVYDINSNKYTICSSVFPGSLSYPKVQITGFDDGITTLSCDQSPANISSNSAGFVDTGRVKMTGCQFFCAQTSATGLPAIRLQFTLTANSNNTLIENQANQLFETTVIMRNNCQGAGC